MPETSNKYAVAISSFFRLSKNDERLTPTHISLYVTLLRYWLKNDGNPIHFTRKKVMTYSKIKSTATYTHAIYDLQRFGYLTYLPSYHPAYGSAAILHLQKD